MNSGTTKLASGHFDLEKLRIGYTTGQGLATAEGKRKLAATTKIRERLSAHGYELVSLVFTGSNDPLTVLCRRCGNELQTNMKSLYSSWRQGNRGCSYCARNKKIVKADIDTDVRAMQLSYAPGFRFPDTLESDTKIFVVCEKPHEYGQGEIIETKVSRIRAHHYDGGTVCLDCAGLGRWTETRIRRLLEIRGLKFDALISLNDKQRIHSRVKFTCVNGHSGVKQINTLQQGWHCNTGACRQFSMGSSRKERAIYEAILSCFPDAESGVVGVLPDCPRLSFDIYIRSRNAAIEFNGTYWHRSAIAQDRDRRKASAAAKDGLHLFILTEDECDNDLEGVVRSTIERIFKLPARSPACKS